MALANISFVCIAAQLNLIVHWLRLEAKSDSAARSDVLRVTCRWCDAKKSARWHGGGSWRRPKARCGAVPLQGAAAARCGPRATGIATVLPRTAEGEACTAEAHTHRTPDRRRRAAAETPRDAAGNAQPKHDADRRRPRRFKQTPKAPCRTTRANPWTSTSRASAAGPTV